MDGRVIALTSNSIHIALYRDLTDRACRPLLRSDLMCYF